MAATRFSREVLEEIKNRASLLEEVRKVVPNLRLKGRDWWGCCPFHGEKSASFHVREDQGYYHCFGCGAHGNVITFVQETRGGNFAEAVEYLASTNGVRLETEAVNPEEEKRRNNGYKALERAQVFYKRCLGGQSAAYLQKRGLTSETILEFGLGFAPEGWSDTFNALSAEGFKPEALNEAGLVIQKDGGRGYYDRFRNRVMFPIHDLKDRVIAFGGRVLDGGEPKYLNSPETPFFNKSFTLYNLNRARSFIKTENKALIVEGYMDAVALWQHGVRYAVAPLGTAITPDQIKLLWRYHPMPICCLDGDTAGRNAAKRLAQRILPELAPGRSIRFMWMPDGEDPDSFVSKYGQQAFEKLITTAQNMEQVLWAIVVGDDAANLKSADTRAAVEGRIQELTNQIKNETVRKHFYQGLKSQLWQSVRERSGRAQPHPQWDEKNKRPKLPQADGMARCLLAIVVRKPQVFNAVQEPFAQLELENQAHKALQQLLLKKCVLEGLEKAQVEPYLEQHGLAEVAQELCTTTFVDQLLQGLTEAETEALWHDRFQEWSDRKQSKTLAPEALQDAQSWEDMRRKWNTLRSRRTENPGEL